MPDRDLLTLDVRHHLFRDAAGNFYCPDCLDKGDRYTTLMNDGHTLACPVPTCHYKQALGD